MRGPISQISNRRPARISALEDIFIGGRVENEGTDWRDCARDDFPSHARPVAESDRSLEERLRQNGVKKFRQKFICVIMEEDRIKVDDCRIVYFTKRVFGQSFYKLT